MSASAAPPPHPPSAVIAADPSHPFTPRPLIADLVRTRCCTPGAVLLVEGVEAQLPVSRRYRAVRLLLGDGELCAQALLRPEMHRYVDDGLVHIGCYVRLNRFDIRSVPVRLVSGADEQEKEEEEEEQATEEMVFLVVSDMNPVGWNTDYMQMAGITGREIQHQAAGEDLHVRGRKGKAVAWEDQGPADLSLVQQRQPSVLVEKEQDVSKDEPPTTIHDARQAARADVTAEPPSAGNNKPQQRTTALRPAGHPYASASASASPGFLPWHSDDLTRPLKLTPLRAIPTLPYKQNWVVNVLAVVASLSPLGPSSLLPYESQRTARLADPSTPKHVHLTVFLDPAGFAPAIGSVVLLLGVKNHRFDGGSLKRYAGPDRPRGSGEEGSGGGEGARWWFENPAHLAWCDVEGLRRWWDAGASGCSASAPGLVNPT